MRFEPLLLTDLVVIGPRALAAVLGGCLALASCSWVAVDPIDRVAQCDADPASLTLGMLDAERLSAPSGLVRVTGCLEVEPSRIVELPAPAGGLIVQLGAAAAQDSERPSTRLLRPGDHVLKGQLLLVLRRGDRDETVEVAAPRDGMLLQIAPEPGRPVQAGELLVRMADVSQLVLHVHDPLDERRQPLHLDSLDGTWEVRRAADRRGRTCPLRSVVATGDDFVGVLDNSEAGLRPGQVVDATLVRRERAREVAASGSAAPAAGEE